MKEVRAVLQAEQHFQVFIKGCPIELRCDHKPLARFLEAQTKNEMVNHWSLIIQEFNITFKWVYSEENISDCLSHLVEDKLFISHPENSKLNNFPKKLKAMNTELGIQDSAPEILALAVTDKPPKEPQNQKEYVFVIEHTKTGMKS